MAQGYNLHNMSQVARLSLYFLLSCLAVILPPILWGSHLPIILFTYSRSDQQIFELFGFCQSIVLLLIGYLEIKRRPITSLQQAAYVLLPLLVGFFYLTMIVEYSEKIWDYELHENATKSILSGSNPYAGRDGLEYLYPPLVAQSMALVYRLLRWGLLLANKTATEDFLQGLVFYLFQCGQYLSIVLAYQLSRRFATMAGLPRWESLLLITGLFLFNHPLIRNFKHDQLNLYVLNAVLIAMITLPRNQLVSGLALSFGGHIKLYPFLFGLPLILMKKWKAVLGVVVGFGVVIFIQTDFGRNWDLWKQYIDFLPHLPKPTALRNNSIYSLSYNLVKFVALPRPAADILLAIATLSIFVWMGARFLQRERICAKHMPSAHDRVVGNLVDCSALMLLLSPTVWSHHYVLGLPLAIWAVAKRGGNNPWLVGTGIFLMFVLPTFDIFPFSYHRISGLFICLWLTSPERIESLSFSKKSMERRLVTANLSRVESATPKPSGSA